MDDKKKVLKKTAKKVRSKKKSQSSAEQPKQKVSVYQETIKRKKDAGKKVVKSRRSVRKSTKFIMILVFFILGFVFSRFLFAPLFKKKDFSKEISQHCSGEYKFTTDEKEFLAISSVVPKPKVNGRSLEPCENPLNSMILQVNREFSEKNNEGTLLSVLKIDEEMRKLGKISKLASDNEDPKLLHERLEKLKNYSESFNSDYTRFKISNDFPVNGLYYGMNFEEADDVPLLLSNLRCDSPRFSYANDRVSHLGLYFTSGAKRGYAGRIWTINHRYRNLIEGQLAIYEYPREPFHRYLPSGNFEMKIHEESKVPYKGFYYQKQWISQEYRFDWDRSPWLYNSCKQSIATISNYCALDPSYDMQYKDIFYLVKSDQVIGNIYCKKSSDQVWTRIGIFHFMRVR